MDHHGRPHREVLRAIARRAMLERGLSPDFSTEAERQLATIDGPARDSSLRDLRELPWCSIDNDDSKDLDQLSVSQPAGDATRILVAVADVDAVVALGTPIDVHAALNTTSVYTPAVIFPMLPLRLSTDLTSLNEAEDRVALVVDMTIESDGSIAASTIHRALVHNHAQLTYNEVGTWLESSDPPPASVARVPGLAEQLRIQDEAAQSLRARRHEQGALDLQTIEPRATWEGDSVKDLRVERQDRAKQLIEDFMIATNGVTTRFLGAKGFPSFRRIVREPERWPRIVEVAQEHGEDLPSEPDSKALAGFLSRQRRKDALRFPDLSLVIVKLLGAGEYAVQLPGRPALGHFGLAVRDYSHSTAPNRRFPDLVTHRLVKAALAGARPPYSNGELERIAAHCTEQEDDANRVERLVRKSAAALVLEGREGERFDGVVTGASDKGTWVRVFHPPVEGKVVRGAAHLNVGEKVSVKLLSTDVEAGYIDFARV